MLKAFRSVFLALAICLTGLLAGATSPVLAQDDGGILARTHDDAMKVPAGKFVQDLGDRAIGASADKNITADSSVRISFAPF